MPSPSPPPTSVHHIIILYLYLKSPLHSSTILHLPHSPFNIVAINHHTVTTMSTTATRPIKSCQNYCYPLLYHCRWLITNISMIISTATTHRCCVIQYQYAIITGQTSNRGHDVDCYPGGCCRVKMTSFTIAWKTAITISHFSYPLHILTVTTTTIHQRIVSHFIRYLYFTQQRRNIHYILWTLRDSLMSDVLPLSSWRSIYIGIGEVGGIILLHLASTWCQRHIWRSWSRGTPHHYFHTAPTRCCVGYVVNSSFGC